MRIDINDKEKYDIEIPDEVSANEFLLIVERLNDVKKMVEKFSQLSDEIPLPRRKKRGRPKRIGYEKTEEKGIGKHWDTLSKKRQFVKTFESPGGRDKLKAEIISLGHPKSHTGLVHVYYKSFKKQIENAKTQKKA